MNLTTLNNCLNPNACPSESSLLAGILQILEACEDSKNLMIGIYLLEKNHFIYVNRQLRHFIGENTSKLLRDGWSFWFSIIDKKEALKVKNKVTNFFRNTYDENLLGLNYHVTNFENNRVYLKHEVVLHKVSKFTVGINYLFDVSDKERIENCFGPNKNIRNHNYPNRKPFYVSPREKEVLLLIANGFSSKEIAEKLFISDHTAISHRKNLIKKFQVKNTAHLIKKALEIIPI